MATRGATRQGGVQGRTRNQVNIGVVGNAHRLTGSRVGRARINGAGVVPSVGGPPVPIPLEVSIGATITPVGASTPISLGNIGGGICGNQHRQ